MSSSTPIVAILGRTNAGKSSLMNSLARQQAAITAREEGTTRDNVWLKLTEQGKTFWLVDTAGFKRAEDEYEKHLAEQITEAIDLADLVVFVLDGSGAADDLDLRVFRLLRKSGKDHITVVNKSDLFKTLDSSYTQLLDGSEMYTSVTQGRGVSELLSTIVTHDSLRTASAEKRSTTTLAIIGRPNTGKSSLFNSMSAKQQAIVSSSAGTTRDINRCEISYYGELYELLDTAGIRRSSKVEAGVEKFSYLRSLWAIENSDICILALDALEPGVGLEQKLAGLVEQAGKGLILAVTKWDLLESDEYNGDTMLRKLKYDFRFVDWASTVFTSSVTGRNVSKILELAKDIKHQRQLQVPTKDANQILHQLTAAHPPSGLKSARPSLKYAVQVASEPTTIAIHGRDASRVHPNYVRYLRRGFREHLRVSGSPVILRFQEKE